MNQLEPTKVGTPCPRCGACDCYLWPTFLWCNTCCDTVKSPSVWDYTGIPTISVEELAEAVLTHPKDPT